MLAWKRYRDSGGQRAFMLLEVLLSVFIISVGVVFVISSFITSIKAFKVSREYFDVLALMEEVMWPYEESGEIEEGHESGDFEDYKEAEWEIEAEELEDLELNVTTVTVELKKGEKPRTFTVVTYLRQKEGLF